MVSEIGGFYNMEEMKKEVDKIELAIKNINKEVQSNHSNEYLVLIGEHIIDCITSEEAAEKVLEKGKSMQGCLSHIQTEAAKKKVGQVAVIQDDIVYGWAREYFGLAAVEQKPRLEVVKPQTTSVMESPKKNGHLSLDDFF